MKKTGMNKTNIIASKAFFVILLAAAILFSQSCTLQGLLNSKTNIPTGYEFHTGKSGLKISFLQNSPPSQVYAPEKFVDEDGKTAVSRQGSEFPVSLMLKNEGAYDIKNGYISFSLEQDYMELQSWAFPGKTTEYEQPTDIMINPEGKKIKFDLEGKSSMNPAGDDKILAATILAKPLDKQSVTHTSNIIATACYEYRAEANAAICLDTDVYNLKPGIKSCALKTITLSGGQGAPVAVAKIEQKMLPQGDRTVMPYFIISISNAGNGQIIRYDKASDACSDRPLKREDLSAVHIDEIEFSAYRYSDGAIRCMPMSKTESGEEYITLKDQKAVIKCTLNLQGESQGLSVNDEAYMTNFYIRLKYGYINSIATQVTSERIII